MNTKPSLIALLLVIICLSATLHAAPQISLDRTALNFGATDSGVFYSQHQTVRISNAGGYNLNWTATADVAWLNVTPASGSDAGAINVSVTIDPGSLSPGTYTGTVTVSDPGAANSPQTVTVSLHVYSCGTTTAPFGSFDTPVDGTTVAGSVHVTGWVLDDIETESVQIYRQGPVTSIYVGDASFVEGARPDVEHAYPNYPMHHKAGWGYMLLTNFLPDGGTGTHTLTAIATDQEGNQTTLGTKTIHVDNVNAVKPFGAIDTPAQGGSASGSDYINWGWALTPQPNAIPTDGSTINVYIDGVYIGHPTYNIHRQDISDLFPDYANGEGAGGFFTFDATGYANGVHTIQWTASDDWGNTDGIGSRYFTIENYDNPTVGVGSGQGPRVPRNRLNFGSSSGTQTPDQTFIVANKGTGTLNWAVDTSEDWLVCTPTSGTGNGMVTVGVDPSGLPEGVHRGTVTVTDPNACNSPQTVTVDLDVLNGNAQPPFGEFSRPKCGWTVRGVIPMTGWVLDDVGVESVKIYKYEGGEKVYIGDAVLVEGARPDVARAFQQYPNNTRAGWSYDFVSNAFPDGQTFFDAYATDLEGNEEWIGGHGVTIDNASAVKPFGAIDTPAQGGEVSGEGFRMQGWVLTPQPNKIPEDGSTINVYVDGQFAGHPTYNQYDEDIAALFPGYANSGGAGWFIDIDATAYSNGLHTIQWTASDDGGNTDGIGSRYFTISDDYSSGVDDGPQDGVRPKTFALLPPYPNPFNPATRITYHVSEKTPISLWVLDILGRRVRTLVDDEHQKAGKYSLEWRGTDDNGALVSSGVYMIVMRGAGTVLTQKFILLR